MKYLLIIGIAICSLLVQDKTNNSFSLKGKTSDIEDSTILFLQSAYNEDIKDSTLVINNSFEFNSQLKSSPHAAMLHTKDYRNYYMMWLEDQPMTFDATKSTFREATITGSETQALHQTLRDQTKGLYPKDSKKFEIEFIKKHPNSIISTNLLKIYAKSWGRATTQELYDGLSEENKKSEFAEKIVRYLTLNQDPQIGDHYIDFEMPDTSGNNIQLSDIKSKVTLLNFWGSWCRGCRQENPNLVKLYEKYHSKGLEIVSVSTDDNKEAWLNAIKTDKLTWINLSDLKGSDNDLTLIYGISKFPTSYLIDENGIIINDDIRGKELEEKLTELLGE